MNAGTQRIDLFDAPTWMLQPGDRLVASIVDELKKEPVFVAMFGESIVPYQRMDFSVRELPALRIFNPTGRKDAETWYLGGDVKADVIFPPSIRREELQAYPDIVASAVISQFRRQSFFSAVRALVPGLNQLGWSFSFDKALGFRARDEEEICPLTQITLNWRVLLDEWDQYLESTDRTVDDPFKQTIGDLERIVATANAMLDDNATIGAEDTFNVKVK